MGRGVGTGPPRPLLAPTAPSSAPRASPPAGPQERLGQPAERLCQTLTRRGPTPAFQARDCTGGPGERGGRVDRCSLTHALAHTQAAGTRQQGGGTPVRKRGEAGLGLALRGFLSPAPGTSFGEQLPSPSHSDSPTGPHITWRLSAPEERGQRGGDRPVAARPCAPLSHATWCLMTTPSARDAQRQDCQGPIRGKIETLLFSNSLKQHKPPVPVIIVHEPSIARRHRPICVKWG